MSIKCPHCAGTVANEPSLAGRQVACPLCGKPFRMPGTVAVVPSHVVLPPMPQQPEPPAFTVRIASDPRTRIKPGGWFSRSFAGAGGALIAAFIFLLACGGLIYGGVNYTLWRVGSRIEEATQGSKAEQAEAMKAARKVLAGYGLTDLSRDTTVSTVTLNADASHLVAGHCRRAGQSKEFALWMDRREFDDVTEWKLIRLVVGDETVAEDKPPAP